MGGTKNGKGMDIKMNHTILAVDDFTMNLRLIQEFLSGEYKIYVARTGQAALETMQKTKIDLFLLDLKMPEMSGIELLTKIRQMEQYKETPVIIISSKNDSITLREVAVYGISDYVIKPYTREVLCDKVSKALREESLS